MQPDPGAGLLRVVDRLRETRLGPPPTWPEQLLADAERSRTDLADAQQLVVRLADATPASDDDTVGDDAEDAAEALRAATDARNTARVVHVRTLRQAVLEAQRRQTSARLDEVCLKCCAPVQQKKLARCCLKKLSANCRVRRHHRRRSFQGPSRC